MVISKEISYDKRFSICKEKYENISIKEIGLSNSTVNALCRNKIINLKSLLELSENDLRQSNGIGERKIKEINEKIKNLEYKKIDTDKIHISKENMVKNVDIEKIKNNIHDNFTHIKELGRNSDEYVNLFYELDEDMVQFCLTKPQSVRMLIKAFNEFDNPYYPNTITKDLLSNIPFLRRQENVIKYILFYAPNPKTETILLTFYDNKKLGFPNPQKVREASSESLGILHGFLKWCSFNLSIEIKQILFNLFENCKQEEIIKLRAKECSYQEIGEKLGIKQENVKRIEKDIFKKFENNYQNYEFLKKISVGKENPTLILNAEIRCVCDKNQIDSDIYLYLLKNLENVNYIYKEEIKGFLLYGLSVPSKIESYVETFPKMFFDVELEQYILEGKEKYDLNDLLIRVAVNNKYHFNGRIYFIDKLSVKSVIAKILKLYFTDGIVISEREQLELFKEKERRYCGDISSFDTDRDVIRRIKNECICCGKNKFKLREKVYVSQDLLDEIFDYMIKTDGDFFLISTLFEMFENELRLYGIDNSFYLKSILQDTYGTLFTYKNDIISKNIDNIALYRALDKLDKRNTYTGEN